MDMAFAGVLRSPDSAYYSSNHTFAAREWVPKY